MSWALDNRQDPAEEGGRANCPKAGKSKEEKNSFAWI